MKPGHLHTAIKTELGHINTVFYWFINLSLSLPEREIGVKLTYGPVGDAPMSIPAFKIFKTDSPNVIHI